MVLDFGVALLYIVIIYSVGQWTVKWLYQDTDDRTVNWLSFAIGFSEMTIVSTFLYFMCGMSVQVIRIIWLALGGISVAALIRRRLFTKSSLGSLGCVIVLWLFLLLPGVIGGEQYYVYRGNCTDQQTYVEETVALSMHPIGWYDQRSRDEIGLVSDVLWRGYQWAVRDRPSAGLMIAVMRCNPAGEIYWVVYLFRRFAQAMIAASLFYLLCQTGKCTVRAKRVSGMIGIAVSVLYCAGFWGQIQYDIDAVSQMASIAVLAALTAVFFRSAQELADGNLCDRKQYLLMILLAAAGLALYLESALVHGALYLLTGCFLLLRERKGLDWKRIAQLVSIPVLSLVLLLLMNYRITGFLRGQIHSSFDTERQSWAGYFNEWWLGRYGADDGRITGPVSRFSNCIVSVAGMYNITPNYERYYGITALFLTGLTLLLACLVLFCMIRPVVEKKERSEWMLWIIVLTGSVFVAGMCLGEKYWSAGKLLYYISPYLYVYLCMPVMRMEKGQKLTARLACLLAGIMLFSNGKMVKDQYDNLEVDWARSGYMGNYPSDMIPGLKRSARFTFDTQDIQGADGVVIRDLSMVSDHQIYLQYLKVKLTCAEIPFVPENDIDYYRSVVEISRQRDLMGNVLTLEAVPSQDGRYEIATVP